MKLVVSTTKSGTKVNNVSAISGHKSSALTDESGEPVACVDTAISMIGSIVETACEYEHDISLMRLVNLIDLYSNYLQIAGKSDLCNPIGDNEPVNFECFIRDSHLLEMAAHAATLDTGDCVAIPPPIGMSANC